MTKNEMSMMFLIEVSITSNWEKIYKLKKQTEKVLKQFQNSINIGQSQWNQCSGKWTRHQTRKI